MPTGTLNRVDERKIEGKEGRNPPVQGRISLLRPREKALGNLKRRVSGLKQDAARSKRLAPTSMQHLSGLKRGSPGLKHHFSTSANPVSGSARHVSTPNSVASGPIYVAMSLTNVESGSTNVASGAANVASGAVRGVSSSAGLVRDLASTGGPSDAGRGCPPRRWSGSSGRG